VLRQVVSGAYDKPFVIDDGTTRTLHFSLSLIQSSMSLKDPFALELDYTQAMMSFLLFLQAPQHILMLGLGGGSLAKFCYRHVGSARITVVEIDPRVIAFRDEFECRPTTPASGDRGRRRRLGHQERRMGRASPT
jgi:spermidine synthase